MAIDARSERSEVDTLLAYLDAVRDAVVRDGEGLDEATLRAPGVPSGTSLLGIVHHLAGVERHWFRRVFRGEDQAFDTSFSPPADRSAAEVVADYRAACADSNAIVRACDDLATFAAVPNPGEDGLDQLRSVVVHLIEETARHAGHADILRERIDGATER